MRNAIIVLTVLALSGCERVISKDIAMCHNRIPENIRKHPISLDDAMLVCMESMGYKFHTQNGCIANSPACYDAPGKVPTNYPFPAN